MSVLEADPIAVGVLDATCERGLEPVDLSAEPDQLRALLRHAQGCRVLVEDAVDRVAEVADGVTEPAQTLATHPECHARSIYEQVFGIHRNPRKCGRRRTVRPSVPGSRA